MHRNQRKLTLSRETVRDLSRHELAEARGGASGPPCDDTTASPTKCDFGCNSGGQVCIALMLLVLIALAGTGCVEPAVSTGEQAVCQDDPDTCPGGHPITLRQRTELDGRAYANQHSYTITGTPSIWCGSNGRQCRGTFFLSPTQYVFTACDVQLSGAQCCSSSVCTTDVNGTTVGCSGESPLSCT